VGGMIERLDSALYLTGLARENRRGLEGFASAARAEGCAMAMRSYTN